MNILLDTVPQDLDLAAVRAAIGVLLGVRDVHHVHAWVLTTGKNVVSMHVLVDSYEGAGALQNAIYRLLVDRFDVYFSIVQLETECLEREVAQEIAYW